MRELFEFVDNNQTMDFDSSHEEPLSSMNNTIPAKRQKLDERPSVWRVGVSFEIEKAPKPRINLFEAAFDTIRKKPVLQRLFSHALLDEMAEKTSQKAVFPGYEFGVNAPLLLLFFGTISANESISSTINTTLLPKRNRGHQR